MTISPMARYLVIQDFAVSLSVILSSLILGLGCDQSFLFSFCFSYRTMDGLKDGRGEWGARKGVAHVRPVDRFTPARKAEKRTASKA
jgi:hypothetical protein